MILEEFYEAVGGSYEDVKRRLLSDRLIMKFFKKFPDDNSYDLLCDSLRQGNMEDAFRAAHTLKGICLNLGFASLYKSTEALAEELRPGLYAAYTGNTAHLVDTVNQDYRCVINNLERLLTAES